MSDSAEEELTAPPLKKARYHWQVKRSRDNSQTNQTDESACSSGNCNENESCSENVNLSGEDSDDELSYTRNTDVKILNTVKRFVNGQTKQIVQGTLSHEDHDVENTQPLTDNSETNNQVHSQSCSNQLHSENSSLLPEDAQLPDDVMLSPNHSSTNLVNISRPLDYITKWQSQQKAKAIVDNAINMTLEEMGLTPNLDQNLPILERLHVEDESISEAIRHRGLYPQEEDSEDLQGTISPLLQQLTQVSDTVFADRLNSMRLFITIRQTARNPEDNNEVPLEWTDELAISSLQARSEGHNSSVQNNNIQPDQSFQLSLNSNVNPLINPNDLNDSSLYESDSNIENEDVYHSSDQINAHSDEDSNVDTVPHNELCSLEEETVNPSSSLNISCSDRRTTNIEINGNEEGAVDDNDLMNFAVNAAINSKGLTMKNE